MKDSIKLNILSPERELFNGEIVILDTEDGLGRLEILPNHVSMVVSLVPTVTHFKTSDGEEKKLFTSSGILKVKDNVIQLLCENGEWPGEIDVNRAEKAKEKAEEMLAKKDGVDFKRAELKLKRALMRIRATENSK